MMIQAEMKDSNGYQDVLLTLSGAAVHFFPDGPYYEVVSHASTF